MVSDITCKENEVVFEAAMRSPYEMRKLYKKSFSTVFSHIKYIVLFALLLAILKAIESLTILAMQPISDTYFAHKITDLYQFMNGLLETLVFVGILVDLVSLVINIVVRLVLFWQPHGLCTPKCRVQIAINRNSGCLTIRSSSLEVETVENPFYDVAYTWEKGYLWYIEEPTDSPNMLRFCGEPHITTNHYDTFNAPVNENTFLYAWSLHHTKDARVFCDAENAAILKGFLKNNEVFLK